ncbi:MAG: lipopolysaccharide biosynthesis protein [Solirubrobacteraceae bacterium]
MSRRSGPEPVATSPGLARATYFLLQADAATAISTLATAIVVARGLGPANRGIFFLALLAAMIIALVGSFGLTTSAMVYAARPNAPLAQLHWIVAAFSVLAGVIGTALLLVFSGPLIDSVLGGLDRTMLLTVGLGIAPLLYAQILGAGLTGLGRVKEISALRVAAAVVTPLALVPAVVLTHDPYWAVFAWLLTTIAVAAATAVMSFRLLAPPARPPRALVREIGSFSLRGYIGTLAHQGFLRVDVLFISARLGPAAVGLYSQASVLAERISMLGHAAYGASAKRLGSDPPDEAAKLTAELVRKLLLIMAPIALALAALAHPFMTVLFGARFEPAAEPLQILLPGTVCLTLWYIVSLYIVASLRRPGLTTIIQSLALLGALPLYWLAVREWGMNGAAAVSCGVYVTVLAAGLAVLLRAPTVGPGDLLPGREDVRHVLELLRAGLTRLRPRRG